LFEQVKDFARFRQPGEDEEECEWLEVGYQGPEGGVGYIFGVDQFGFGRRVLVYKKGCLPDADEHLLPLVVEVAVDINKRVVHQLGVQLRQELHVDGRLGFDGRVDGGGFGHAGANLRIARSN